MLTRILVPVDFSSPSAHALAVARDYCPEGATIRLLHVISASQLAADAANPAINPLHTRDLRESAEREVTERLARWAYEHEEVAVEVGNPPEKISQHADQWRAGMIVMGTRSRSGLSHFLHGSATEWLVRHARQPVLAVHDVEMDPEQAKLLPPMEAIAR